MKETKETTHTLTCLLCGEVLTEETVREFEGRTLCENCYESNTTVCDHCGDRIWDEDDYGDGNIHLCLECHDDHYTRCNGCNRLIRNDDAYYEDDYSDNPYCEQCYNRMIKAAIKSYYYKPEPIFYGSGDFLYNRYYTKNKIKNVRAKFSADGRNAHGRKKAVSFSAPSQVTELQRRFFMGVELEIDKGGECGENAEQILDVANPKGERIYCKHDGSIGDGFEMVSHPMTLEYHLKQMNWKEVFNKAIELGYRSHQTSTCGLHIHVSREALGDTYMAQEATIARIIHFVELHWNELLKFSRRTEENINRWANRYGIAENTEETYKKAKSRHLGRYVAVNLENNNTIEFRMFRGTLRYETFVATLDLIHEICSLAIRLEDKEMERMSWCDFVMGIDNTKQELIDYLKMKRLYVNEIENEMEEM